MKRKILALMLAIAIIAVAVIGGTMAYFTDTDAATNVFVMGNIDITLHEDNSPTEQLRDDETDADGNVADDAYRAWLSEKDQLFFPTVTLEKDAWVANDGVNDAYVRVYVLWPKDADGIITANWDADLAANWTDVKDNAGTSIDMVQVEIDGVAYVGRCLVYNGILAPGAKTSDTITSVYLHELAECDTTTDANGVTTYVYSYGGKTYVSADGVVPVVIYAEAGQTKSGNADWTDNPNLALNTMFGVPGTYVPEGIKSAVVLADNQAAFSDAIKEAQAGDTIVLTSGEYELAGSTKNGVTIVGTGDVIIDNNTNFAGNGNLGAITKNMTFENVTFGSKIYTMGDGAYATFRNCTFLNGVRGAYARAITFDNCTFYENTSVAETNSDYGYALHFEKVYEQDGVLLNDCDFISGTIAMGDNSNGSVTFTDCTFSGVENSKEGYIEAWTTMTFVDCTFDDSNGTVVINANQSATEPVTLVNTTGATVVNK